MPGGKGADMMMVMMGTMGTMVAMVARGTVGVFVPFRTTRPPGPDRSVHQRCDTTIRHQIELRTEI
jgi:hypothetical protein